MERNDSMSLLEGAVAQGYDDQEHRWKVDGVIPPLNRDTIHTNRKILDRPRRNSNYGKNNVYFSLLIIF